MTKWALRWGWSAPAVRTGTCRSHPAPAWRPYETNFELTYRAPITRWLTIQPDIQYRINPNMDPRLKNDLLFMIYFEISHIFNL